MAGLARRPTVLIVLHQEHSTPARVGRTLREMGARLDIRRPSFNDPLPKTLAGHDGAVIFGGPMGVNDSHDWIRREIDWLEEVPLAEGKPFLGICLGAQMLASALGARVFTYEDKRSEIGYFPISPTAAADRLCEKPFPRCAYQWHADGFDLPEGAELLATGGADFPNQAFRYGKAVGLQFHPEVTYHMMCRWTIRGAERLTRPGAQSRPLHLGGWYQHDGRVAAWLEAFLPAWMEGRLGAPAEPARPAVQRPKPAEPPRRLASGRRPMQAQAELAS